MSDADYDVCRPCGACCAAERVVFPNSDVARYDVPRWLVVPTNPPGHAALRGTLGIERRCEALSGEVGVSTGCRFYANRPSPCRAFQPSRPSAINPYCDAARARYGLSPLV